jgi:CRP-like cAMP-binding protein
MATRSSSPTKNDLLAALPAAELEELRPYLEELPMPLGHMLYEPGTSLRRAFFPTTSVVSLHHILQSGASAESAGVGHEGVVGISLFMGGNTTPSSAVVQVSGIGYALEASILQSEFARSEAMRSLLLRYTQSLIAQINQTAICNRHHSIKQQLCRWLLMTLDRMPSREIVVTQDMIAGALGVRRESVTDVAGDLQRTGMIRYRRGHISVIERSGLERAVCECYAVVAQEMTRLRASVKSLESLSHHRDQTRALELKRFDLGDGDLPTGLERSGASGVDREREGEEQPRHRYR